jgi:predicted RNase H-like nuclease (RuvC/YqgF family)
MYEQDPKQKIDDPMEHILREIGVEPPKKFLDTEDLMLLKEENEDLKLQVDRLERTYDELQQELQNVIRNKKMQKQKESEKVKSPEVSAHIDSQVASPKPKDRQDSLNMRLAVLANM